MIARLEQLDYSLGGSDFNFDSDGTYVNGAARIYYPDEMDYILDNGAAGIVGAQPDKHDARIVHADLAGHRRLVGQTHGLVSPGWIGDGPGMKTAAHAKALAAVRAGEMIDGGLQVSVVAQDVGPLVKASQEVGILNGAVAQPRVGARIPAQILPSPKYP